MVVQKQHSLPITFNALPHYGLKRSLTHEGNLAEILSLSHVGDMNLNIRNADGFQCVEQSHRSMRICRGVDDDGIGLSERLLNAVNQCALVVALEKLDLVTQLGRSIAHELAERLVILLSVDIGLANAKHIDVRPIHNKKFHEFSSAHRSCAARNHSGK